MWLSRFESWPGSPTPGRSDNTSYTCMVNTLAEQGEPPSTGTLVAVVLAAGQGTRMRSRHPKVLHPPVGNPLIQRVLDLSEGAGASHLVVLLGRQAEPVR